MTSQTPPSPDAARERRDEIAPLLERAQRAYHSGSEPILTDEHYDRLVHELRDIESAFPHLAGRGWAAPHRKSPPRDAPHTY